MDSSRRERLPKETLANITVEYGEQVNEEFMLELCDQLLTLLDDPERYPESLMILHGIWSRGNLVRFYRDKEIISEQLMRKNKEVAEKAQASRERINEAFRKWPINHLD